MGAANFPTALAMILKRYNQDKSLTPVRWDMAFSAVFQILGSYLPSVLHKKSYLFGRQVTGNCSIKGNLLQVKLLMEDCRKYCNYVE